MYIDHIVISVNNLRKSVIFYSSFLGKPRVGKDEVFWKIGKTKLFITKPYIKTAKSFNKHDLGLNHIAFSLKNLKELRIWENRLQKAKIKHSGILINKYSHKQYLWFDDPDNIRLEFYL